jgi:hypothetical protein
MLKLNKKMCKIEKTNLVIKNNIQYKNKVDFVKFKKMIVIANTMFCVG